MSTLELMPHGTSLGAHERLAANTHKGMAHFAGSGPDGETCRTCVFWKFEKRYFSKGGRHGGQLKPCACRKFKELMNGTTGAEVPHNARACKYWQATESPPSEREK
jgi:hypothetical protein